MKWFYKILLSALPFLFISCSEDGMPNIETYTISKIYSIKTDGTDMKFITRGGEYTILPEGKIIFIDNYILYSCSPDGTDRLKISPQDIQVYAYQLFMNNTKILLNNWTGLGTPVNIINSDGTDLHQLSLPDSIVINGSISFSPDGNKIVYTNIKGMFLLNLDGISQLQLRDSSNRSYFSNMKFTPDGGKIIYIDDIQSGVAYDLRSYEILTHKDTTLFFNDDGNKVIAYDVSNRNSLLFSAPHGIYKEDLINLTNIYLHPGGDPHFSNDSTKITFMNSDFTSIVLMDLTTSSTTEIEINLPGNYIRRPLLYINGERIYFQADSSWDVVHKPLNNDGIVN